ncbi:MAG: type II toxin-antitoxin system VapC family toxin [Pleurocapsa sp. SU_196_0]|nr:type II toxin-antitoxin system VapC family toxin [Pleurocapsa sp. SU_196_0]
MIEQTSVLVDTNAISELQRKRPDANVRTWFAAQRTSNLYLSSFTIGEIEKGIHQHPDPEKAERLRVWFEGMVVPRFINRILTYDAAAARVYGRWAGQGRKNGLTLPVTDAQIAAIAYTQGLSVATRNIEDFAGLPIRLVNPWTAQTSSGI